MVGDVPLHPPGHGQAEHVGQAVTVEQTQCVACREIDITFITRKGIRTDGNQFAVPSYLQASLNEQTSIRSLNARQPGSP